jgi:hypothetical protein
MEKNRTSRDETSLTLAVIAVFAAYVVMFCAFFHLDYGISNLPVLLSNGQVFLGYLFQALGGTLAFPAAHVAVFSLFKSKRNPSTRRRIFIGWSILLIASAAVQVASTEIQPL